MRIASASMKWRDMASIQYLYGKELHRDPQTHLSLTNDPDFGYRLACQLPHLLREKRLDMGESDKIFASEWLSEDQVVIGTKCNKLFVLDLTSNSRVEIPTLRTEGTADNGDNCGIHCISVSKNGRLVATGGQNPNEVAIYRLPEWEPIAVGQAHRDWLFDCVWLTNDILVTGSRDATMVAWEVSSMDVDSPEGLLAEGAPKMEPLLWFSNTQSAHYHEMGGEKVRSIAFSPFCTTLGSLQTDPFGASVHFWDVQIFQELSSVKLPYCAENVCLEVDTGCNHHLFAAGSRSHISLLDNRDNCSIIGTIKSIDNDCGVRSLKFSNNTLSIGTGGGHLYFYDIRAGRYLGTSNSFSSMNDICLLKASRGYLRRDEIYRDYFSDFPDPPDALYTHCYSPIKSKIFIAGGPLPLGLYGNYAAVWL